MLNDPPLIILHVDDNETTRYIVSRMLRNAGFVVVQAATGEAGLELLASQTPDLIVLDVKLPDISGFEVCQRIKSNPATASIPVLHLSASHIESKDKAQGLDSGADGYLVHPVESIELIATVKSLLRIRKAEESALALAQQWQITFDSISDGVGLLDQQGRFIRCNTTLMSLLQKPLSEIIGRLHQEVTQTLLGAIDATPFSKIEASHHRDRLEIQSNSHWYSVTIDPIFDQTRFTGAVYILADITDRRRAEEALRFLAEASNVMATSLDYQITLTNVANLAVSQIADWCMIDMIEDDGLVHRLAVSHRDETKAELAKELAQNYPLDSQAIAGMPKVIKTGIPELANEISDNLLLEYARDKQHLQLLQSLSIHSLMMLPLIVNGQVIGAMALVSSDSARSYSKADLVFAEDLARRVALAVDNTRLYREAQDTNRMKDEFLATLSHELRSPLNSMLGWIRLLNTRNFDEATKTRAMETIERSAKSQAQLVEDLLDVSRIIQGKLRLDIRPVELIAVIEAAIETVMPAVQAKEIQLQVVLDPAAGPVAGDFDRLQQIVWNLLSNAIKFTPKGGVVSVRLERVNSSMEMTVIDTGQGISSDFVPYVFDRFRQADSSITRVYGGLGLGLAIVRHLVELHGGTVKAESPGVGKGATFKVRLPQIPLHVPANTYLQVNSTVKSQLPVDNLTSLNGVRVLIVDDEIDSREFLGTTLEHYGADVTVVDSVSEALAAIIGMKLDVLISDIGMPTEDGYSLIRKVRRLTKEQGGQIPAIALTAYARAEDRMKAIAAGFQIHIPKPVEPAELATVVASLTGRTGLSI